MRETQDTFCKLPGRRHTYYELSVLGRHTTGNMAYKFHEIKIRALPKRQNSYSLS